jgi:hypothetical protein
MTTHVSHQRDWLSTHNQITFLCFPDWRQNWNAAILTQLRWSRQNRGWCWTPSKNFQDAFKKWQKHWERCIREERDYFEGDSGQ